MPAGQIVFLGDVHGPRDKWELFRQVVARISLENEEELETIVCQCGDFGYFPNVFDFWPPQNVEIPDWMRVFFIRGNHDNSWALQEFQDCGKPVEFVSRIFFVPDGLVLEFFGQKILFIGGAETPKSCRAQLGIDYWPGEVVNMRSIFRALNNCQDAGPIDFVLSHTCPSSFEIINDKGVEVSDNGCRRLLQEVFEVVSPDFWFFGHYHANSEGKTGTTIWQDLGQTGEVRVFIF